MIEITVAIALALYGILAILSGVVLIVRGRPLLGLPLGVFGLLAFVNFGWAAFNFAKVAGH